MNINGNEVTRDNIIYVSGFQWRNRIRAFNIRTTDADFWVYPNDIHILGRNKFAQEQIMVQLKRWVKEQADHDTFE